MEQVGRVGPHRDEHEAQREAHGPTHRPPDAPGWAAPRRRPPCTGPSARSLGAMLDLHTRVGRGPPRDRSQWERACLVQSPVCRHALSSFRTIARDAACSCDGSGTPTVTPAVYCQSGTPWRTPSHRVTFALRRFTRELLDVVYESEVADLG